MRGYLNQFEENRKILRGGMLHTGDLGYMDSDGYIFIVDRLKEMIISGGYKIFPRNIEEILYQHPSVAEAAVIGVHHPQRGQVVKIFVAKKEGKDLSELEVKDYLKDKIAGYAMPHAVEFRDSLPKSAIGKILKKVLMEEEKAKQK
jgi:long-chain acyl-CoA synthetase